MRNTDRATVSGLGGLLCLLGVTVIGRPGVWFQVLGWFAIALGFYVVLASLFGWPLPQSAPTISAEERKIADGLGHLMNKGVIILRDIRADPNKGRKGPTRAAFHTWTQQVDQFVRDHFTEGHYLHVRDLEGLHLEELEPGPERRIRGYIARLLELKREVEGRT
jgi:uncharacterized protein (DUF58 family)